MSSFGEELKRERELRRITLREVAESTKISIRHLEALEKNEFEDLPGGVFNRGFVRAYAQYIGIDPDSTVTSYLMEEQSRVPESGHTYGHDGVFRRVPDAPIAPARLPALGPAGRNFVLAALAVLFIAILALAWLWIGSDPNEPNEPTEAEPATAAPAEATAPEPVGSDPPPAEGAATEEVRLDDAPRALRTEPTSDGGTTAAPVLGAPEPEAAPPVAPDALLTRIHMLRPTTGRVDCDNTRIEMLGGLRAGTKVEFLCRRYLMIDAEDGGAVQIGVGEQAPRAIGRDGQRIAGKRIDVAGLRAAEGRP